ncbi:hypothetical protein A2U01_0030378 [Trifolium medium]|uniref:Uncharacterized protein n=1 Tax=Trifolium medium TaxID=97028 RepID=A0A392PBX4_9FABA|nr:hypothetical protein [Trifolium medium]
MESTSKDGDKGKRPTKVTASARRKNTAENPPKKRSQKRPAQPEVAETAHSEPKHHEGESAQAEHHQPDDMEEGDSGDDVVRDMEDEEMEQEGDAAPVPILRPAWDRELISVVSSRGKLYDCCVDTRSMDWWEPALKATGMWGLSEMGYIFLDPGLLSTFVER